MREHDHSLAAVGEHSLPDRPLNEDRAAPGRASRRKREKPDAMPRRQFAALPFRCGLDQQIEVMLVSSRETRRWVLPKGWPMRGHKPHMVAAIEALEEAGLTGKIAKKPIGSFHYIKRLPNGAGLACRVEVFAFRVTKQRKNWLERDQRTTGWFPIAEAAGLVAEPELGSLIAAFVPPSPAKRESAAKQAAAAQDAQEPAASKRQPSKRQLAAKKALAANDKPAVKAKAGASLKAKTKKAAGAMKPIAKPKKPGVKAKQKASANAKASAKPKTPAKQKPAATPGAKPALKSGKKKATGRKNDG